MLFYLPPENHVGKFISVMKSKFSKLSVCVFWKSLLLYNEMC